MYASLIAASKPQSSKQPRHRRGLPARLTTRPALPCPDGAGAPERSDFSFIDLGDSARTALMLVPQGRGDFRRQVEEVLARLVAILLRQVPPMIVTVQTVFLRDARQQAECEQIFEAFYGAAGPVTNFVVQPPCCGAALALEAWAIGGDSVRVEHYGPQTLALSYDHVRWVYCAGIRPAASVYGIYHQTLDVLEQMRSALVRAGSRYERVVRTWLYLGGITEPDGRVQRYQELNRARSDFYRDIEFYGSLLAPLAGAACGVRNAECGVQNDAGGPQSDSLPTDGNGSPRRFFPASTGIGMAGLGLVTSCLAFETNRSDVALVPLENPHQTPAYDYHHRYSSQSPKFSRAMALVLGDYVTTWISGTASIVDSESQHLGDIERQTEQTLDNIERLIASENFAAHNVKRAGAGLQDLAKIRVYIKRGDDFAKCRAICERRLPGVPAIYAVADVCRSELLVEIEGVAFSRCSA
jgi:enamine deaminase RidA (YjgF/YER057c/UK114 family)